MRRRILLRRLSALAIAGLAGCGENRGEWDARQGPPESGEYVTETTTEELNLSDVDVGVPDDPGEPFVFVETDYGESDAGDMVVTTTVENTADERRAAVLVYEVTVDGTTYAERETVRLDAGERGTYTFEFDLSRDEYAAAENKGISPRWEAVEEDGEG
ncbi:hypothetical protein G9464_08990 [Halostella sp. JP-L12]|uniref:hypothetical protein n=1 Tax=Halostella TaxID=1843185 RepID=UPI000EF75CFA|nr:MULTISPECIES: hypothetical protein [Halostella]NHN47730.1 hypothetical protein [Halostella sp. JP-L12]